jgi:hypothetical protein
MDDVIVDRRIITGWWAGGFGLLHNADPELAAFHGNAPMAREILRYHPPLERTDADFKSTPLGWAIHGSEHGWYCETGDYPGTVELLLNAGVKLPETIGGTDAVQEALERHGLQNGEISRVKNEDLLVNACQVKRPGFGEKGPARLRRSSRSYVSRK